MRKADLVLLQQQRPPPRCPPPPLEWLLYAVRTTLAQGSTPYSSLKINIMIVGMSKLGVAG